MQASKIMDISNVKALNSLLFKVDINNIKSKLLRMFMILNEKGLQLSDRRKGKILKAIAAHALLEKRYQATESDLIVLKYTVPKNIEDFEKIGTILMEELKTKDRVMRELEEITNNIKTSRRSLQQMQSFDPRLLEIYKNLKAAKSKVQNLVQDVEDEEIRKKAEELNDMIESLSQEIMIKLNM